MVALASTSGGYVFRAESRGGIDIKIHGGAAFRPVQIDWRYSRIDRDTFRILASFRSICFSGLLFRRFWHDVVRTISLRTCDKDNQLERGISILGLVVPSCVCRIGGFL